MLLLTSPGALTGPGLAIRGNGSVCRVAADAAEATERVGLSSRVRDLAVTDALAREEATDGLNGGAERSERSGDAQRALLVKRLAIPVLARNGLAAAGDSVSSSSGFVGRVVRRGNTVVEDDAIGGGA